MPVGAAIGGAAVIGAGASIYSSNKASKAQQQASQQAADATLQATRESNALQQRMYDQNRADLTPWRLTGMNALADLADLSGVEYGGGYTYDQGGNLAPQQGQPDPTFTLGGIVVRKAAPAQTKGGKGLPLTGLASMIANQALGTPVLPGMPSRPAPRQRPNQLEALMNAPGYQFRLAEGNKALDRSAAARGGLYSGATLKALSRYNQDFASNEYGNRWNQLAAMAGVGQAATNQTGAWGQNAANTMSNGIMAGGNAMAGNYMNAGNARASNYMNMGNTINNTLGDAAMGYGYYRGGR